MSLTDFDKCLKEGANAGNVIFIIENIHAYEALYEKLMPYLHSSHLGIVVTTHLANYDKVIKNHAEFLSKFEKVDVDPTNEADTISILKNNARMLKISIEPEAILEIVHLADRLIGNAPEPAKSIAILEEAKR